LVAKKTNNITEIRNLNSGTEPARSKSLHQIEVKAPYTTTIRGFHTLTSLSLSLSLSLASANSNAINKEFKTQASKSGEN
jgi:hypothetical protein